MSAEEDMLSGKLYVSADKELVAARLRAKELCFEYNGLPPSETEKGREIIRRLLGKIGEGFWIEPPFYCDYGTYIEIGKNFYSNHNLVILDCSRVRIGDNVFIAPNVGLYGAGHPLDVKTRNSGLEYGKPITIGNNVWIGGSVVVNPGVTIGDNTVIGSGSVVTKDIPANVVAAGNPCRVLKNIEN